MPYPAFVRNPRYGFLDACRGIACLMVVFHHAGFALLRNEATGSGRFEAVRSAYVEVLRHLDIGVPLFFVISGYCIGASVDATRRRGSSSMRFLIRRVWRIYPPYWMAVGWFLLVTIGLQRLGLERLLCCEYPYALELILPQTLSEAQWVGNLTLTESWRPLVGGGHELIFTRVAWSLCYEEQFYFLCFVVLLAAGRRLYGTLATLTVVIVLFRIAAADVGALHRLDGLFVDLWHEFAVGLAVYWRLNLPIEWWQKRAVELGLVVLMVVGLSFSIPNAPVQYSTATASAFGLVLIAARDFDEALSNSVWLAPLRACGHRSYSMYLVHLPVTTVGNLWLYEQGVQGFWQRGLIAVPLVSAAAVAVSFAFFSLVERHFLNPPIVGRAPQKAPTRKVPLAGESPRTG